MIPYRFGPCMFGPARRATSEVGSEAWRSGHQGPKLARRSTRAHPNSPNPDRAARRTALLDCMTSGTLRLEQLRAFRRVAIVHGEIAVEDGRSRRLRVDNGEVAELDNRLRWLFCRRHALRRNQQPAHSRSGSSSGRFGDQAEQRTCCHFFFCFDVIRYRGKGWHLGHRNIGRGSCRSARRLMCFIRGSILKCRFKGSWV